MHIGERNFRSSFVLDICGFLNDESANGYLSPDGKSKASLLIDRSKHQLQTIAIINAISDAPQESYVDMNGSKGILCILPDRK